MGNSRVVISVIVGISILSVFAFSANAEPSAIPDWVKNNAKWWSEDQIGESDYISALEYLIGEGIIKIQTPITEVTATSVSLSDNERAQSFVVHFKGGDFFTDTVTIYTYSQFIHISETITGDNVSRFQDRPAFLLRSLPSYDKAQIYDLVNEYVSAGKIPEMFDVSVEVVSGDGSTIMTWEYRKCAVVDFAVFVDDDKDEYRFSDKDEAEIRDVLIIECGGFSLLT